MYQITVQMHTPRIMIHIAHETKEILCSPLIMGIVSIIKTWVVACFFEVSLTHLQIIKLVENRRERRIAYFMLIFAVEWLIGLVWRQIG